MSRRHLPSWRILAIPGGLLFGLVVLSTCTPPPIIAPRPEPPATTPPPATTRPATTTTSTTPTPPGEPSCTIELAPTGVADAVADARPGDVLCVSAGDLGSARLVLRRDGTETEPIVLRAVGSVTTEGIDVEADWWSVEGFTVTAGAARKLPGIAIAGVGVHVTGNHVDGSTHYGISCDLATPCDEAVISGNVVTRPVGTGIWVYGDDILAEGNDVSGSVQITDEDADGFRFFGNRITLRRNYVHDIDAHASPGDPHSDCFQTFPDDKQPSTDVLIDGNTCDRVSDQCLIAEGAAATTHGLRFVNNICRNQGSQALQLTNVHDVLVANNLFLDTIEFTGVFVEDGTDGVTIVDNAFVGDIDPFDGTNAPSPAFRHNLAGVVQPDGTVVAPDPSSDGRWTNDPGLEVAVPGYLAALGTLDPSHLAGGVPIATTDPTVDAGVAVGGVTTDLLGSARPADGDGDGSAAPDVGPFEAPAPTPPPPSTTTTTPTTDEPTTTELTTTTEATGP